MVNYDILKKLRDDLPRGAAAEIKSRLAKKGKIVTVSYINMVLDPDDDRTRADIIDEAIILRDEYLSHKAEIENRILHPQV